MKLIGLPINILLTKILILFCEQLTTNKQKNLNLDQKHRTL